MSSKAREQQARTDSVFSRLGLDAGRAEEIATRRVMAGESHDPTFPNRNEAGNGLAPEGDLGLAGPALGEILPHPRGDFVLLGSQSAPYLNSLFAQPLEGGAGVRQVIELYEHVHRIGITWRSPSRTRPWSYHPAPQSTWQRRAFSLPPGSSNSARNG